MSDGFISITDQDVDRYVRQRLRERRVFLGISQEWLSDQMGIAAQQIAKYETGQTRLSMRRLFQMASLLDTPVGYFFPPLKEAPDEVVTDRNILEATRILCRLHPDMSKAIIDVIKVAAQHKPTTS